VSDELGTDKRGDQIQAQGDRPFPEAPFNIETGGQKMNTRRAYYSRQGVLSRFFRRTYSGERMNVGAYMWAAQRVTGLLLLFYLLIHLYTLSAGLSGIETFDQAMEQLNRPVIKILEVLLLGTVFFHALNGVRLILVNFFADVNQKKLAYGMIAGTLILTIISVPFVFQTL
jgi:succinate dehydrogenase / fumarate reductase cytochrome b subunit